MKRNIVINSKRTAIVISDNLVDAVKLVSSDTNTGEEVFAFDTSLHIVYSYEVVSNGFTLIEAQIPLKQFRNFALIGTSHEIYMSLINSIIK